MKFSAFGCDSFFVNVRSHFMRREGPPGRKCAKVGVAGLAAAAAAAAVAVPAPTTREGQNMLKGSMELKWSWRLLWRRNR